MQRLKYFVLGVGATTALSFANALSATQPAIAQAAYGSYIGIGPSLSLTENSAGEGRQVGGVVSIRYKFLKLPVSLRTQALIGANTAVVPTVSYDLPLNWQTDAYLGAGVVFAGGNTPTPVGNQTSFALQPGIDFVVPNSNTVIFGNAVIAFDAYSNGGGNAVSIQGGIGLKF